MKKPLENIYLLISLVSYTHLMSSSEIITNGGRRNFGFKPTNSMPNIKFNDLNNKDIPPFKKRSAFSPVKLKLDEEKPISNEIAKNPNLKLKDGPKLLTHETIKLTDKESILEKKNNKIILPEIIEQNQFSKISNQNIVKENSIVPVKNEIIEDTSSLINNKKKEEIQTLNNLSNKNDDKLEKLIEIDEILPKDPKNLKNSKEGDEISDIKENEISDSKKNKIIDVTETPLEQNNIKPESLEKINLQKSMMNNSIEELPMHQTLINKDKKTQKKDSNSQIVQLNQKNKKIKSEFQKEKKNLLKTETFPKKQQITDLDESIKNKEVNSKIAQKKTIKDEDEKFGFEINRLLSYVINIFLIITGIYITFFGFQLFRVLMSILGFYVSYYLILFFLTELDLYNSKLVEHQLGLFFACIVLGFFIAILCYTIHQINFLIFGVSIGSMIALMCAQFFIDFKSDEDRIFLLVIYLVSSLVFSFVAFLIIHDAVILGSSFVGSIVAPINFGVIMQDFKSFEDREKLPKDCWEDFIKYLIIFGIMFTLGVLTQYYFKVKIVKNFENSEIEEMGRTSNLN